MATTKASATKWWDGLNAYEKREQYNQAIAEMNEWFYGLSEDEQIEVMGGA